MSLEATRWATSPAAQSTGAARGLLCILADKANIEYGHTCWPSDAALAEAMHCSVRSIWRYIAELKEWGDIAVQSGGGRSKRNVYSFPALADTRFPANNGRESTPETLTNLVETLPTVAGNTLETLPNHAQNPAKTDAKPCQSVIVNPATVGRPIKQPFLTTTEQQPEKQQPPPPTAGGGGLPGDAEIEALLEELQTITGRSPANYERAVLSIAEYGHYRRRALLELRRDWVTVKAKSNTGWWLKRVIERLIEEHVRANAPLFPIDEAAAREERRRKYIRDDDEPEEGAPWVPPWEAQPATQHEGSAFWM